MQETTVDVLNFLSDSGVVGGVIILGLDIYHVQNFVNNTMPNRIMATKQTSVIRNQGDVFIQLHLVIHHRTNLQKVKLTSLIIVKIDSKLYLNRTRHLLLPIVQHLLQEFWQREDAILQHT